MIVVSGGYQTKFGELWDKSLKDLIIEAGEGAIKDAKVKKSKIDLVIVGNKLAGKIGGQEHLGSLAIDCLGIRVPGIRVEAACSSGGLAIHQAVLAIKAKQVETVLVIGVEKMTDKGNGEIAEALMGAASEEERRVGLSFVGLYALMARVYMEKFGVTKKDLAKVAVKNHKNALKNNKAHFQKEIDINMVLKASMVAEPLGLFDCSPISDGAAGVVISKGSKGVEIVASEIASDSLGLSRRKSLIELEATQVAVKKAYLTSRINPRLNRGRPDMVDLAEVHDCFTIGEILALEDLGLAKKGEGYKGVKIPINTSGGLKACGHPVGATGVKQIVEIYKQLNGKAGKRQVKNAKIGLTHNVGGTGGTAVVHILRRQ
ncbi:MAG: thiolase domain-containing protein [Patescibacteria group bacterium]|nr:thiolase domain-containing protein [Patescibacteria group bacterium]